MCNLTKSVTKDAASLAWTPAVATVDASKAVQLVTRDPHRRSLVVTNDPDSAGAVRLLPDPALPPAQGARLKPGAGMSLSTAAPVYVIAEAGTTATVTAVCETGCVGF